MSISVITLRTELRIHLGDLDTDDLSDADADLLLNRSFWELIDKFPFREKERSSEFNFTAPTNGVGVDFYTAPVTMEAVKQISVQDPVALTWTVLERMTSLTFDENADDTLTTSLGPPVRYMRQQNGFKVQPAPDQLYVGRIWWNAVLDDLAAETPTPTIPQVWHEIILAGAVYRGFMRFQDFTKANQWRAHQTGLINSTEPIEAKEEMDTHLGGVDLPSDLTDAT